VLNGITDTTGASEVPLDPTDSRKVYAVLWDHRRQLNKRSYSGIGSGAYRSVDGGNSWQRLDSLAPSAKDLGRIDIGVAPTSPSTVYATLSGYRAGSPTPHVFVSHNFGTTWQDPSRNLPSAPVNDLIIARTGLYVSTDQGVFVSFAGRTPGSA
jgi:hypothetical protein